ncbi:zinc-binding dehydrogenase, putative [Plasmodium malariae]|uniref:Zinc-binding dehydrogenase, putative n=1 Tax=Plasmodium malariae TaxID=5858 RepID=A0A1D3JLE8_PLAMA|nr:zinc-binding dehydrogenase, putative [Plasmodium malariae]SBT87376.1 zinc-binding dehydrogenase, putative [Plasmodium malariae]
MRGILLKGVNKLVFSDCLKKPMLEKGNHCRDENDLLIKVCASGINRIDILIKQNKYAHFPRNKCLGIEISGIIEESNCERFKKNDRVCSLLKYNGYCEYVLANSKHTMKIDNNTTMSMIEAASLPESFLTAYKLIYYIARFPLIGQDIITGVENINKRGRSDDEFDGKGIDGRDEKVDSEGMNRRDEKVDSEGMNRRDEKVDSEGMNRRDEKVDSEGMNRRDEKVDGKGMDRKDKKVDGEGMDSHKLTSLDKGNSDRGHHFKQFVKEERIKSINRITDNYFQNEEVNVLVYGSLSSVGINLLQLLNFEKKRNILKINKIIAVTSNEVKAKKALEVGATDYVFHNKENFVDSVLNITKKINLIFDCIGKSMFENNIKICTYDTVWILYGLLSGAKVNNFNLFHLINKRILLLNTTLYDRSDIYKEELINSFQYNLFPLLKHKILKPYIYQVLDIEQVEKAHYIIENNLNIGKVVCQF